MNQAYVYTIVGPGLNTDVYTEVGGIYRLLRTKHIKKAMEEAKFYFGNGGLFSDETMNFKSNVELYNELKQKFYKIAA